MVDRSNILEKYAAKNNSAFLTHRMIMEEEESGIEIREAYQRDRDRIIHSRAFRRLMHKTQIFNANKGDHYRNRLTHTLEVSQIARSIGKVLGLNDELIEAIALGHDLGHTPFGHIGERTLHRIISGREEDILVDDKIGFKHNFQGMHVVDNLETHSNQHTGMNLTLAVREGILKHTKCKIKLLEKTEHGLQKITEDVKYDQCLNLKDIDTQAPSCTLEGQVVAIADEIAQCTHDLEDGIRAGIVKLSSISKCALIEKVCRIAEIKVEELELTVDIRNSIIRKMVGYLIEDVCKETRQRLEREYPGESYPNFTCATDTFKKEIVAFSDETLNDEKELADLTSKLIVMSQEISQADSKAEYLIKKIFKAYYKHPQQLPDYILNRYFFSKGEELNRFQQCKAILYF